MSEDYAKVWISHKKEDKNIQDIRYSSGNDYNEKILRILSRLQKKQINVDQKVSQ